MAAGFEKHPTRFEVNSQAGDDASALPLRGLRCREMPTYQGKMLRLVQTVSGAPDMSWSWCCWPPEAPLGSQIAPRLPEAQSGPHVGCPDLKSKCCAGASRLPRCPTLKVPSALSEASCPGWLGKGSQGG